MAAKLLGPEEPTISALSLRRVCLAWAAGVFRKTCGGKRRVRVGKYRKVQGQGQIFGHTSPECRTVPYAKGLAYLL